MHLRSATPDDVNAIAQVHVASWQTAYRGILPDDFLEQLSVKQRSEQWKNILGDPDQFTVVAVERDRIVGFANGGSERSGHGDYNREIYALYLLREFHGLGLGRKLFWEVAGELANRGGNTLLVWVLQDNPSRAFYERIGGTAVNRRTIEIAGKVLQEVAYGWLDLRSTRNC